MTLTPTRAHEHTVIQDAVRELMRRIPELTDRLIACLRDGARPDELRLVSSPAFRASAQTGLRAVLEAVASVGRERPDMPFARQVGRRYAERRIPLETALRTYRLAGTLLWESMVDVITARHPEDLPLLVTGARRTMSMVDQLSLSVTEAYRQAQRDLRDGELERALGVLDDLLDGRPVPPERLARAAARLDLPRSGRYAVLAVRAPVPAPPPDRAGDVRLIWRPRSDVVLGVAHLGAADLAALTARLSPLIHGPAGIGLPVEGVDALATARRLADLALRCAVPPVRRAGRARLGQREAAGRHRPASTHGGDDRPPEPHAAGGPGDGGGIVRLDECLPAALVAAQPDLARHLRDVVVGPLLDLDPAERDTLLETVAVWLDCGGSTARAARRLFCHRNTVLGRIRRVERLTGRRLGHPREAAEIVLALESVRLARAAEAAPNRGPGASARG
ncbi:PucR family transcriptional regulator [Actinomadura rubrobrunea]|uniref:PucR family transcriptional regulator n=1 Tax=Actinomadura rubrobrunea TaxID=115335 RepID=A0A9W6UXM7_9ACTN|nr:helix-turn-helix domain-containing protein [Actinomadura rubrobrunea]GLW67504.1 PucR family transcriptional regulator [Actinomadura rubrobrunea]